MDTNLAQARSKKPLIVVGGVILVLVILAIAVMTAIGGGSTQDTPTQAEKAAETNEAEALSVESTKKGSEIIDGSTSQLNESLKEAEAAMKDETDHQKVGQ